MRNVKVDQPLPTKQSQLQVGGAASCQQMKYDHWDINISTLSSDINILTLSPTFQYLAQISTFQHLAKDINISSLKEKDGGIGEQILVHKARL